MKRPWLVIALALVLGAAFCVQATSTWRFGESRNLADLALPALVVLLEVGSITAAAIFFSARAGGLRVRALLMLSITAGLGGAAGVIAYGWAIGVPVAVLMVGLVEVVGAYRRETALNQQDNQNDQLRTIVAEPVEPEPEWSGPETVELPRMPDTVPTEVSSPAKLKSVGWSVEAIVADLRERGETDLNQRGIRDRYGVGAGKANRVLAELQTEVAS